MKKKLSELLRHVATVAPLLFAAMCLSTTVHAGSNDEEEARNQGFAKAYFEAWTRSQRPGATEADLENYLSFLSEDVGHQHLPYDVDDERVDDGKENMRKGMRYYLV